MGVSVYVYVVHKFFHFVFFSCLYGCAIFGWIGGYMAQLHPGYLFVEAYINQMCKPFVITEKLCEGC